MQELINIIDKYDTENLEKKLETLEDINNFSTVFYKDVGKIYNCITRVKNTDRNPSGFSIDDAPILGLLVKISKLLKEVINYYEQNNAEMISLFERPILESSVTAVFLMRQGKEVLVDYRKCSYKDRLRILRNIEEIPDFYETKAGKRLLKSINKKMEFEGFSVNDFGKQKKNNWKLQGKSFYDINKELGYEKMYHSTFGMMSENIHGSWNDSMDWCLIKNDDETFLANPFHHPADIRYVGPLLIYTNNAYRMWLKRIDAYDENFITLLDWIEAVNRTLYNCFDNKFDGP